MLISEINNNNNAIYNTDEHDLQSEQTVPSTVKTDSKAFKKKIGQAFTFIAPQLVNAALTAAMIFAGVVTGNPILIGSGAVIGIAQAITLAHCWHLSKGDFEKMVVYASYTSWAHAIYRLAPIIFANMTPIGGAVVLLGAGFNVMVMGLQTLIASA